MSSTKIVREKIWGRLKDVAIADSRFHMNFAEVIPDFVGSEKATDRLVAEPFYEKGSTLSLRRTVAWSISGGGC